MRVSCHMVVEFSVLKESLSFSVSTCGTLLHPNNGFVVYSMSTFGATATYLCNEGFDLIGNSTRQCQSNGLWEGVAPVCQSKLFELEFI